MHRRVFRSDDGHRSSRLRRASTKISLFCLIIEMFTFWEVLSLQTLLNFFASAGHHHPRVKVIFSLIVFEENKIIKIWTKIINFERDTGVNLTNGVSKYKKPASS